VSLFALTGHVLWVLGLALLLADLGWRLWRPRTRREGLLEHTPERDWQTCAILLCIGIALATGQAWARILFACVAAVLAVTYALQQSAAIRGEE
jgi:hypothetical protein